MLSLRLVALVSILGVGASASAAVLDKDTLRAQKAQKTPTTTLDQVKPPRPGERPHPVHGLTPSQLVNLGRFLFTKETFRGNGRTCATCHPSQNNFTLDPQFIAALPKNDPLFVAENQPALANLENPLLLRQLALICENLDGFDKPCVFRSVPQTLALRTSSTAPLDLSQPGNVRVPGTSVELANATGWSGDGAPIGNGADGSLRLFALGAIVQHFPRTLARVPGVDFRLPSELELDALLAFQLSLGRQYEADLSAMTFKSPVVERGKAFFVDQDPVTGGRCTLCHDNAGANRPINNPNAGRNTFANTRAELTRLTPAFLLQPDAVVVDGGFGLPPVLSPTIPVRIPTPSAGFGNGQFSTPPLIEAAITPPFFHNNMANTIEQAVAFYGSPEFNQPNPIIIMDSDKSTTIAAFLRSIGSLELIDRALTNNSDAMSSNGKDGVEFVEAGLKNIRDAWKVLYEGVFYLFPEAQEHLYEAARLQERALQNASVVQRDQLLTQVAQELAKAQDAMVYLQRPAQLRLTGAGAH